MLPKAFLERPLTHRALHGPGRPENSRAAIEAAIQRGYGIEIDLQLSQDGQAMVFHDYDLARLTNETGLVAQRNAAELSRIALRDGNGCIPTLAEVLELVGGRVPLLIELKDQHGDMGRTDGRLEAATAAALAGYDGPSAVMSFNPEMILRLAELAPCVPRGLTTSRFRSAQWPELSKATRHRLRAIPDFGRVGACFISHERKTLNSAPVRRLKRHGVPVLTWTIKSEAQARKALEIADNITFEQFDA